MISARNIIARRGISNSDDTSPSLSPALSPALSLADAHINANASVAAKPTNTSVGRAGPRSPVVCAGCKLYRPVENARRAMRVGSKIAKFEGWNPKGEKVTLAEVCRQICETVHVMLTKPSSSLTASQYDTFRLVLSFQPGTSKAFDIVWLPPGVPGESTLPTRNAYLLAQYAIARLCLLIGDLRDVASRATRLFDKKIFANDDMKAIVKRTADNVQAAYECLKADDPLLGPPDDADYLTDARNARKALATKLQLLAYVRADVRVNAEVPIEASIVTVSCGTSSMSLPPVGALPPQVDAILTFLFLYLVSGLVASEPKDATDADVCSNTAAVWKELKECAKEVAASATSSSPK